MENVVDAPWDKLTSGEFQKLAQAYGTPFYLYDASYINQQIDNLRVAFNNFIKVFYAVKANPNLELLRAIKEHADGLDISSGGELQQALLAGYEGSRLSFAGPAKSMEELELSIENGIGCISIESLRELNNCIDIAKEKGLAPNIAIRINPLFLNRAFGIKMGGKAVQFGIDEENMGEALSLIEKNIGFLNFKGIHVYAGSQCFEPQGVADGVTNTFRIVEKLEATSGLFCSTINLGGGFGLSHSKIGQQLDITSLSYILNPIIKDFQRSSAQPRDIIFELGRYLTADAGIYVTRVLSSKTSRGKEFFLVDGGLHHHLAAAGTFGAALRANFILRNLTTPNAERIKCNIAGPSCNPTDLLGVNVDVERPQLGDLLGVLKSGSYGFTASPLLFLGRKTPVELIKKNGEVILGRKSYCILDLN